MIQITGRFGGFDHARLAEDLRSLAGPIAEVTARGRALAPPLAMLERLGADLLFATPGDHGARALQADDRLRAWLAGQPFGAAMGGEVRVSWLAAAFALGRTDLRPRFRRGDALDLDAALRWLVLHGVREHGLFELATERLVGDLTRRGARAGLTPLARLLLRERADLAARCGGALARAAAADGGTPAPLADWLAAGGAAEYRLEWCLPVRALAPPPAAPAGWAPPAEAPPMPLARAPDVAGRVCALPLDRGPQAAALGCFSDRAVARAAAGGVAVFADDLVLRLPAPPGRDAVLMIRGAADPAAAAEEVEMVALCGGRPLGTARLRPREAGCAALPLRGVPRAEELALRLCRTAPAGGERPWARWLGVWLVAA